MSDQIATRLSSRGCGPEGGSDCCCCCYSAAGVGASGEEESVTGAAAAAAGLLELVASFVVLASVEELSGC